MAEPGRHSAPHYRFCCLLSNIGKERFIVNPFPEMQIAPTDRLELRDLANNIIMSNLDKSTHNPTMEGKVDDVMYGVMSEDLETMRVKASYVEGVSGAAVLEPIVVPTIKDPFQSLIVKWMELDIPFASTSFVKNRDYVIRGNASIIGFCRQSGPNSLEAYATGIFDPCGDMIRMLVVPGMASAFLSSVKYANCGHMRKLSFMLDKAYSDSKMHGTPKKKNVCVTCSAAITRRNSRRATARANCASATFVTRARWTQI